MSLTELYSTAKKAGHKGRPFRAAGREELGSLNCRAQGNPAEVGLSEERRPLARRGASRALMMTLALFSAFGGSPAHAEIAVMESGKILYIDSFHREDKLVTLHLTGGGEVTVASELVANIVPNEIAPEDETEWAFLPILPQLDDLISPAAERNGLDPRLVAAVIWVESSGDPKAVSHKGAKGLMQLMPQTAETLGVQDVFNPEQNIDGGARYLKRLLDQHDDDVSLALASYNAGPSAVARHGGIPPYPETRKYVKRVLDIYEGSQ